VTPSPRRRDDLYDRNPMSLSVTTGLLDSTFRSIDQSTGFFVELGHGHRANRIREYSAPIVDHANVK